MSAGARISERIKQLAKQLVNAMYVRQHYPTHLSAARLDKEVPGHVSEFKSKLISSTNANAPFGISDFTASDEVVAVAHFIENLGPIASSFAPQKTYTLTSLQQSLALARYCSLICDAQQLTLCHRDNEPGTGNALVSTSFFYLTPSVLKGLVQAPILKWTPKSTQDLLQLEKATQTRLVAVSVRHSTSLADARAEVLMLANVKMSDAIDTSSTLHDVYNMAKRTLNSRNIVRFNDMTDTFATLKQVFRGKQNASILPAYRQYCDPNGYSCRGITKQIVNSAQLFALSIQMSYNWTGNKDSFVRRMQDMYRQNYPQADEITLMRLLTRMQMDVGSTVYAQRQDASQIDRIQPFVTSSASSEKLINSYTELVDNASQSLPFVSLGIAS